MAMESNVCYICCDKRRSAYTDTSLTKIDNTVDAETLKDVLVRALSQGFVDDSEAECQKKNLNSRVCVVSLSRRYDGSLEAVSEKVLNDLVIICRRCSSLLKEFEYHERTLTRIAEEIRNYLSRQNELDDEDSDHGITPGEPINTTVDEKRGILAALRAFKKSGTMPEVKKRGKKRKLDLIPPPKTNKDTLEIEEQIQDPLVTRTSKRIQQRREDGLVINWGEEPIPQSKSDEALEDFEEFEEDSVFPYQEYKPRKKRLKKHQLKIINPDSLDDEDVNTGSSGMKHRCPFCQKYYIPSNSKIHNCTTYKNRLRCHLCNIFFTSYIRLEKHFEVIHLKQPQLKCLEVGCVYSCITDPAFVLHKHFHFLENAEGGCMAERASSVSRTSESSTGQTVVTPTEDSSEVASVRVIADLQGEISSPSEADQVSFLLSEKNFLEEGHPEEVTTDKIVTKNTKEKNLHIQTVIDDKSSKNVTKSMRRVSAIPRSLNYHCPFCDRILGSQKTFQEHVKRIHSIEMKTTHSKGEGEVVIVLQENSDDVGDSVSKGSPGVKKNFK